MWAIVAKESALVEILRTSTELGKLSFATGKELHPYLLYILRDIILKLRRLNGISALPALRCVVSRGETLVYVLSLPLPLSERRILETLKDSSKRRRKQEFEAAVLHPPPLALHLPFSFCRPSCSILDPSAGVHVPGQ